MLDEITATAMPHKMEVKNEVIGEAYMRPRDEEQSDPHRHIRLYKHFLLSYLRISSANAAVGPYLTLSMLSLYRCVPSSFLLSKSRALGPMQYGLITGVYKSLTPKL